MSQNSYLIFETKIGDNAVISFDLFDTLVESTFFENSDLFELMSPEVESFLGKKNFNFKKIRLLAEKLAHKNKKTETIDLNDIYAEIKTLTNLEKSHIMEIEKIELCYEQRFYQTKNIGQQIYGVAKSLNKKIIIVTDTYLPRFFIEGLLERTGYTDYDELFLTSDIGLSKKTGNIFPYVCKKMYCDEKYFLHIGDDEIEDVKNPQIYGINTMSILSSKESYINSFYYQNIWKNNESNNILSTRLIHGLLALNFYKTIDNQSLNSDKIAFNQDPHRLGYFGLGPILLSYIQWIIQKSQDDYTKHIYFLSNNGSFIKKAYDTISRYYSQAPIGYELLASSQICKIAKLCKPHELFFKIEEPYSNINIKDLFLDRFSINISKHLDILEKHGLTINSVVDQSINEKQVFSIFEELISTITTNSDNEKNYYSAYLRYNNLPNPDHSALVDIGFKENIQSTISEIAKQKIGGYYLVTFIDMIEQIKKQGMQISGYLGNFEEPNYRENPIDLFFNSVEKEFLTFELNDNTINPIFTEQTNNEFKIKFITEVQESALKFIADFETIYNKHIPQFYFSPKQTVKPLLYFLNQKTESSKIFKNFTAVAKVEQEKTTQTQTKNIKDNEFKKKEGIFKMLWLGLLGIKKSL
ncbi:hypothetical protein GW796_08715 [archaeon]|nr:hypothetical protein [archaeon]NCQ51960.1 hypothetical protein [archaeon]